MLLLMGIRTNPSEAFIFLGLSGKWEIKGLGKRKATVPHRKSLRIKATLTINAMRLLFFNQAPIFKIVSIIHV